MNQERVKETTRALWTQYILLDSGIPCAIPIVKQNIGCAWEPDRYDMVPRRNPGYAIAE